MSEEAEKKVKSRLSAIWLRLAENIDQDYLELFIITSRAAGLEPSLGRSFGLGKTTMALWLAYRAWAYAEGKIDFAISDESDKKTLKIIDNSTEEEMIDRFEKIIENYYVFSLDDVLKRIAHTSKLIPAIIFDDVQDSCPNWQHIPPLMREKIEALTRARQRAANIIMTAPSISSIAKPLRDLATWEIIIPSRGVYEVQFIGKRRDFYNPIDDLSRLWYEGTGNFDPLPPKIDARFKVNRDEDYVKSLLRLLEESDS